MKPIYYYLSLVVLSIVILCYSLSAWHGGSGGSVDVTLSRLISVSPASKNLINNESNKSGPKALLAKSPSSLSKELVSKIKTFVLFIGKERSGSSIVGALMNAHPHMAIAHEYFIFKKWPKMNITSDKWTSSLYNSLYRKTRDRYFEDSSKGYILSVNGLWQGKMDGYLSVIGDKGGGTMLKQYKKDKELLLKKYHQLKSKISIPIRFIHPIRNPFDHIATSFLYLVNHFNLSAVHNMKIRASTTSWKYNNNLKKLVLEIIDFFERFEALMEMVGVFGRENVHVVHSSELVHSPRETMSELCEFVGVESTKDFLDECERKAFKGVSRSRDVVVWNERLIEMVEEKMKRYPLYYQRYSFTSD